jgi:flavin reductase (DIM6/NTAB) family NADH-FMN oxidoreductase RutF
MREQEQTAVRNRFALRRLVSGVAVLTFLDGGRAHATTVSSMSAVSRDPLLIGLCLSKTSYFARLVTTAGQRFAANILGAGQVELASWFADPNRPKGIAQFDCVEWTPDSFSGAPLIAGSLANLGCRLTDSFVAGDHRVLIGEVITGEAGCGDPLLSFAGQLHDGELRSLPDRPAHPAANTGKGSAA